MKHLILVRHAKSSWKDSELDDHDRPLGKRGERDAPFMAKIFRDKKLDVDLIVSSTALRAFDTAKEFAKKLDYKKEKIVRSSELYLAESEELLDYVKALDDDYKTVMLFGHNPGITWFANHLTNGSIENIPTCGIAAIDFEVKSWSQVNAGSGILRYFEYPKMYLKDAED
jgi:phosphohistidine phosphatase